MVHVGFKLQPGPGEIKASHILIHVLILIKTNTNFFHVCMWFFFGGGRDFIMQ